MTQGHQTPGFLKAVACWGAVVLLPCVGMAKLFGAARTGGGREP